MKRLIPVVFAALVNFVYFSWLLSGGIERIQDDTLETKMFAVFGAVIGLGALASLIALYFKEK